MTSCSLLCLLLFLTCASPQVFRAELCPSGTYVTISRLADNCVVDTHVVKQGRANKALRILHTAHLDSTESTRCCSKNCMEKFSRADLISRRLWYLDFATELEAKKALVNELKPHYDDTKKQRRQSYHMPMHQGNTRSSWPVARRIMPGHWELLKTRWRPSERPFRTGAPNFCMETLERCTTQRSVPLPLPLFLSLSLSLSLTHTHTHTLTHTQTYTTQAMYASRTRAFWRQYDTPMCAK